ncbi:hypothetical protein ACFY9H_26820 [Streptomyces bacillaris]|uniref:Uncharacterized protein n=1 Tax=Streptomyces cavourensis TaxID=67258 RepID=A0AAD0VHB7_9ACTN|nr:MULTISPECIES: hypothetical protein [Streptomyces]ATY98957.1 hypothetical protein CVT27_28270 [Streptomyces cavourensis]AXI74812.1 hypothetical protein DTW94_28545 [Streptomyces cavourensis]NUV83755.1 hypothetical protein [Streptomyces sp. CAI-155]TQO33821.1 hypothetical protein FHX79_115717 [Streptomyces cavourensis]UTR79145.1 hypothetical protein NLU04_12050 [Streptomyces cavourensis]
MTRKPGTGESGKQGAPGDDELAALVAEFSFRKTYRPTDDLAEPDEMPHGPSGTAMGDGPSPVHGSAEPDAP